MLYRAGLVLGLSVLTLAGCSRLSISNNSMAYKNAKVLAPLQLPAAATRPMNAIYPAPVISQAALETAPEFSNHKHNRYELPLPKNTIATDAGEAGVGVGAPSAPALVTDGNGFPLLRIEGDATRIWELLNASLSVANIQVVSRNQGAGWISVKFKDQNANTQTVFLRLNRTGIITTITVQNEKNVLIDKTVASELLTQLNQNWPA